MELVDIKGYLHFFTSRVYLCFSNSINILWVKNKSLSIYQAWCSNTGELNWTCYITCSVQFSCVRTSSLVDTQALVFHSQNVNWITKAQINPRREKMQIPFYINQFHLWNNSMFLVRICFFFFFIIYTFLYLYIFILEMLGKLL